MGETATCLILHHHHQQPFSYAAGISNESVSFGRFKSESLSWEKWSSFSSSNKYVEEAEKFSRPGSVAEKKAFFEAHYRDLAAKKAAAAAAKAAEEAAAAAAAVAETNCVESEPNKEDESNPSPDKQDVEFSCIKVEALSQVDEAVDSKVEEDGTKDAENSVHKQMEKPLLKDFMANDSDSSMMMKRKPSVSFSRTLVFGKAAASSSSSKVAAFSSPAAKCPVAATPMSKRSTPKSTHSCNKASMNFTPVREINRLTSTIIRKIDGCSRASYKAAKDFSSITPLRTPTVACRTDESRHPQMTPQSETWRARTPLHPSAATTESKPVRPRWHFLPTDCSKFMSGSRNKSQDLPSFTAPFRTEERAARRKKKLEEKFNAKQEQKVQLQATIKEKAETEVKKFRQSLCFKARPLPGFYKQIVTPKNQLHKVPLTDSQPSELEIQDPSMVKITTPHMIERSASKNSGRNVKKNENNNNPRSLRARLNATATENTTASRQQTSKTAS